MIRFGLLVCLASAVLTAANAQDTDDADSADVPPATSVQSESDADYVATEGHIVENRRSYLQRNSEKNTLTKDYLGVGQRLTNGVSIRR